MTTGFNKPKYGNSEASWTRLKIPMPKQDGDVARLVVRILPPYGNLAAQRKWSMYHSVHYGFEGRDSRDPTKTRHKPFGCVEEKRRGMVVSDCPMCNLMQQRKKMLESKVARLKSEGKTDDEAKALTKDLSDWLRKYNVDRKHYMATMTEDGRFHVFMLSHETKKRLESAISKMLEQDIDPLDLDGGVWFEFRRSGNPKVVSSLVDEVDVVMEKTVVNGRSYLAPKPAPLSEDQANEALRILPSLDKVVTMISRDQIQQLVNCSGDPEEVDAIYNSGRPDHYEDRDAPPPPAPKPVAVKPPPPPVKVAPPPEPEAAAADDDEDGEIARMEAMLAAKKAAKAAAGAAASAPPPPPPKPVAVKPAPPPALSDDADLDAMSNEDFLRQFPDPSVG